MAEFEDLPEDVLPEIFMNMSIEELLNIETTSTQYKRVIDKLWCRLLQRDLNIKEININKCKKVYVKIYKDVMKKLTISKDIDYIMQNENLDVDIVINIFTDLGYEKRGNKLIFIPKINQLDFMFKQFINGLVPNFNIKLFNFDDITLESIDIIYDEIFGHGFSDNSYIDISEFITMYNIIHHGSFNKDFLIQASSYKIKSQNMLDLIYDHIKLENNKE